MRRKNDLLWKGMLEEIFDDLLRFIFPQADQVFDMQRGFEFMDKELSEMYPEPDKPAQTRFVDKLVKVFRQDGYEEWLLVHVEVQGQMDRTFAERMFRYYYRIFDRYRRPVTALAIFTGQDGKSMPDRYSHSFLGAELWYKYNTLYITDYADDLLSESDNPFALVMLAAKTALLAGKVPEKELLEHKLLIVKLLFKRGLFDKRKIEGILAFLKNYILFEDPQTNSIFTEQLDQITGKINTMGIIEQLAEIRAEEAREQGLGQGLEKGLEQGLEKGRTEERQRIVKSLLTDTEFSLEKIASLAGVSISYVKNIKEDLSER